QVGLKSIWEVKKLADGASLAGSTTSPVVIHVSGSLKDFDPDLLPESNHSFFLFDVDPVEDIELAAFEELASRIGWPNVGIYAASYADAEEMIGKWLDAGYEQNLINGLLGDHLVLFLRK
ncbi:hypothetical protein KKA08_01515, partial [bacterium]|nr:hypothetical protein [bacterium]